MVVDATFLNFIFLGSVESGTLVLIALGFSLIYGVGGIFNLAHGTFYVIGGYIAFSIIETLTLWGLNIITPLAVLIIIIDVSIVTVIGGLMYLILVKSLQETPTGVILITFAFAYFIQQFLTVFYVGHETISIPELALLGSGYLEPVPNFKVFYQDILIIIISIVTIIVLLIFLKKSKLGNSIRAVSQDKEAATLMGINSNRVLLYTVMIATFLAGIAAMFSIPSTPTKYDQGFSLVNRAFAIVILGGMGSVAGTVLGSCVIGFSIHFIIVYGKSFLIPLDPTWANIIPMIIIVIMIIVRPQGIFGKKEL